jgi:C_GCAxxG_C_C family probable redox protein
MELTEQKNYKEINKQEVMDKALSLFDEGYACSQSILLSFAERFNLDENTAKFIASTFGGGMGRLRKTCGAVTGSFMVLGLAFGNTNPKDMETKLAAYKKVRELNEKVENIYGTSNCYELLKKHATETDVTERKHHKMICRRVIGDVAGIVYDMME